MNFPDMMKDPTDVDIYSMDWTSRLGVGEKIASTTISVNGDCTVVDKTSYPSAVLSLQISGGSGFGWTGDPQMSLLSVVTVVAVTNASAPRTLSRSFNVIERQM